MSKTRDFRLCYLHETPRALSPYRLFADNGASLNEVPEVNDYLDAQATRGLSPRSLRTYGYSLLNFWRWLESTHVALADLCERDVFLDYVRLQRQSDPEPLATTINHRITVVCCLYQFHFGHDLPAALATPISQPYHSSVASPTGYLYPARRRPRHWRMKSPRRVVVALSGTEVRGFLESFSTWRDLALTALMLLCGLRSREIIELLLEDLDLTSAHVRVLGKGQKERVLPLPGEVIHFLGNYLELERPAKSAETVFVSLKGKQRGQAMTPAGLRSLFRHHRRMTAIEKANPHRWRHTFATELAAAGISLPALMKLLGHSDINTTMRYVELSPQAVHAEFQRIIRLRANKQSDDGDGEEKA